MKTIFSTTFALLLYIVSTCHIAAKENNHDDIKTDNIIGYINYKKQREICNTEETKGANTGAINACADALVEDSRKKLKEKLAKARKEVNDFNGPYNIGGGSSRKTYRALFEKSQKLWEAYVQAQCDLIVYPNGEPALYFNRQFCIAAETYIRIDELDLH